jgi:glycerol-3-phosphate acyltransferase PlsY
MEEIAAIAFAYIAGSVPFAYLVSRRRGIDLRRSGSGNVGAANVLRTSGVRPAVAAAALDAAKGAVAVIVAERLAGGPATPVAAGLASMAGHLYPVWLRFRGGKGVATAAGVFAVLAPAALAIAVAIFVVATWWTRYVSVGSMAAAVGLAVASLALEGPADVGAGACVAAAMILHRHRGNLARLAVGTERRIGQRVGGS